MKKVNRKEERRREREKYTKDRGVGTGELRRCRSIVEEHRMRREI